MEGKNGNGHGGARAGAGRKRKIAGTTAETIQGLEVPGTVSTNVDNSMVYPMFRSTAHKNHNTPLTSGTLILH